MEERVRKKFMAPSHITAEKPETSKKRTVSIYIESEAWKELVEVL